ALHAHLADSTARYVLFEPQMACRSKLDGLMLPGKTIISAALSSAPGRATLLGERPGIAAASLYERHDTYFGDTTVNREPVELTTVDLIVDRFELSKVDLLKLDVEGAELE